MEEPGTRAHKDYVVLGTRGRNFISTRRASWMRDKSGTMSSGLVDVVAERDETVRRKNDVCKLPEPACPVPRCERFGYDVDDFSQSSTFFKGEVALDVADLPVDPVLTPHVRTKSE
jgi:hypothetical protein